MWHCDMIKVVFLKGERAMKTKNIATVSAILAAALYAINVPLSKLLLSHVGIMISGITDTFILLD